MDISILLADLDTLVSRDLHGWAGPHGFTVRVVTATASGRDIAAQAPPVPVPRVVRVFSHARVILNLRTASRNGGSLSDFPSLSTPSAAFEQRFLHGDFRIAPSFTFFRPPPATFPYGDFWDPARCRVGWYTATLVCFPIFSFFFFFLLTSSFAAKSSHTTLLADGHGRHFPLGPTGPHTIYLEGYVAFAQDARLSHRARPPPRSDAFAQHAARTSLSLLLRVAQGRSA